MTPETRLTQLLSDLLDHSRSASVTAELQTLLIEYPSLRSQMVDHLVLDVLLQENLGQEPMIALVDAVSDDSIPQSPPLTTASATTIAAPHPRKKTPLRWLAGITCLATAVAVIFWQIEQQATASAAELVKAAMHTHAASIERIYIVEVRRGANTEQLVELPRDVRVATQGDRFWVHMRGQRDWAWGRDEQGAVWITLGDRRAVVVHADEMGLPLRYIGDLYTLNLETLLESFLKYCRLELSDETAGIRLITATPRRQSSDRPLKRAVIEVERETGAIRRLVLERELERTSSVTTFTLVESRAADSSLYGPIGHLAQSGRVFGMETAMDDRRGLLLNWFGSRAEQWLRPPESLRTQPK
ncbi:MAG: hypothetical protein ACKO2L_16175 [Planctomycetaceae bacterium]